MTDMQLTREEWLAARPGASPEFEQARFGGDVPSAEQLAIDEINPFNSHLFREDRWQEHFARLRAEDPCTSTRWVPPVGTGRSRPGRTSAMSRATGSRSPRRRASRSRSRPARPCPTTRFPSMPSSPWIHRTRPISARPCAASRLEQPSKSRRSHPRTHDQCARLVAGRRDLRLGRRRVDRAHHAHARHPVRFPARRPPLAHQVVRSGHDDSRARHPRRGDEPAVVPRPDHGVRQLLRSALPGTAKTRLRHGLDARPRSIHQGQVTD